jgi:hypothetical protein
MGFHSNVKDILSTGIQETLKEKEQFTKMMNASERRIQAFRTQMEENSEKRRLIKRRA